MEWRLLPLRVDDAFMSMAIEEALLRLNSEGKVPNTVRFWRWSPSAVSLGCFQSLEREVDLEAARRHGVDVVRRITGGGAVFHDQQGELTYSVVCRENDMPRDIVDSYKLICNGLVQGLGNLGIKAEFRPINDVQVNGKKISGSAQTRRWGSVLQHGTILISPDVRLMFEILKVSPEKISDKFISSVFERVTTIERELGKRPSVKEVREAMIAGFERALNIDLVEMDISKAELDLAAEIRPKYASQEWLRKR
ncbi:MAG: lipoate--protein ligase family protein [Candidatus Hadarchaeum sp.]|uniref:lipoate--protein ligase family protein n=1 Tax=Candidatus Hadarchaeum sp. TaxID=2883567 RepID=UPI003D12193A